MSDKWRVLLADHDKSWRELARDELGDTYEVIEAETIDKAHELLQQGRAFDVAIVHLGLLGTALAVSVPELVRLLKEGGTQVGLYTAITLNQAKNTAEELNVPIFNKGRIDSFSEMVESTLLWGHKARREQE